MMRGSPWPGVHAHQLAVEVDETLALRRPEVARPSRAPPGWDRRAPAPTTRTRCGAWSAPPSVHPSSTALHPPVVTGRPAAVYQVVCSLWQSHRSPVRLCLIAGDVRGSTSRHSRNSSGDGHYHGAASRLTCQTSSGRPRACRCSPPSTDPAACGHPAGDCRRPPRDRPRSQRPADRSAARAGAAPRCASSPPAAPRSAVRPASDSITISRAKVVTLADRSWCRSQRRSSRPAPSRGRSAAFRIGAHHLPASLQRRIVVVAARLGEVVDDVGGRHEEGAHLRHQLQGLVGEDRCRARCSGRRPSPRRARPRRRGRGPHRHALVRRLTDDRLRAPRR